MDCLDRAFFARIKHPIFFADSGCRCVWIWAIPPKYWITDMQFSKEKSSVSSGISGVPYFQTTTSAMRLAAAQVLPAEKGYIIYRPSQGRRVRHKPRVCQGLSGLSIIDWCFPSSYFVEKKQLIFGDVCPHGRFHDEIHESPPYSSSNPHWS